MYFVDGTNLLRRISDVTGLNFRADKPPEEALNLARGLISHGGRAFNRSNSLVIREYWFASYQGNDEQETKISSSLRHHRFEPILFKKQQGREKGVDIALTKEMLVNAFNQNYDIGFLIAGDEDYLGVVSEVKRYGPRVFGAFFENGLSTRLKLAFDEFFPMPSKIATIQNLNKAYQALEHALSVP